MTVPAEIQTPTMLDLPKAMQRYSERLGGWRPETTFLPDGVRKGDLAADLRTFEAALKPCTEEALAVCLGALRNWIRDFQGLEEKRVTRLMDDYAAVLGKMPGDLAWKAVQTVKANYVYGAQPPKPGDLNQAVHSDILQRMERRARIRSAVQFGQEKPRQMDRASVDERKAHAARVMEEFKRKQATIPVGELLEATLSPEQMARIDAGKAAIKARNDAEGHEANKRRIGIEDEDERMAG